MVDASSLGQPLVVLGAARSGTKLLRDMLAFHPSVRAVPFDVNFVWKYGNYHVSHDVLTRAHARPEVQKFVRGALAPYRSGAEVLVEKTVSNTLRVPFVHRVLPEAKFIHLVRDGRDVTESAMRQWQAPLNWRTGVSKLRALPAKAWPAYLPGYLRAYVLRKLLGQGRVESWGPHFADLSEWLESSSLLEVCAVQWSRCVEAALDALEGMSSDRWIQIRYEDLVSTPGKEVARALALVDLEGSDELDARMASIVMWGNVGKGAAHLGCTEMHRIVPLLAPFLTRLGYL